MPPWAEASAQADTTFATPTCAEQGQQRVAVMIPPGRTLEEMRETLVSGTSLPVGTQVTIIAPGDLRPLRNERQFGERMRYTLFSFLDTGYKIDGTIVTLLVVDEKGTVVEARPGTGNRDVDRRLERTWKLARFEPYEIGGCRVRAYVHVPLSFTSDFDLRRRRLDVKPPEPR
jgi:hypothetical protein